MHDVKRFRDRRTGKMYVKLDGRNEVLEIVNENNLDLVEIGDYVHSHIVRVEKNIHDVLNTDYSLKDTLTIPIDGEDVVFVVEHIEHADEYDDVYFVSRDIVGKSSMKKMPEYLDEFESKMPSELVSHMKVIEHISESENETKVFKRKLNLLSLANVTKTDNHYGKDDILFDGLRTEAERCKNYKSETEVYWLRSPYLSNSSYFYLVYSGGYLITGSASYVNGVVPCFSIRIKKNND